MKTTSLKRDDELAGSGTELDRVVERFEMAWHDGDSPKVRDFLPSRDDAQFMTCLCELIRVDLEYGWQRGNPTPLGEYRRQFPELFSDGKFAAEVAYEEYRLRRQAGQNVAAEDYAAEFCVDVESWPGGERPSPAEQASPSRDFALGSHFDTRALDLADRETLDAFNLVAKDVSQLPTAGDRFAGFELEHELGRGAFGRVFLARQRDLGDRRVALKVSADIGRESHALSQLQHTNVVPIYSVHRQGRLHAVCMPYLGSATLADVLSGVRNEGRLPDSGRELLGSLSTRRVRIDSGPSLAINSGPASQQPAAFTAAGSPASLSTQVERLRALKYMDVVLWLAFRLVDGLAHAHARGILHRDLKPANVLFSEDGEPVLLDFNLATDAKLGVRATAALIGGTLPYMAPEHLQALMGDETRVDEHADLYSVGVILFELFTGRFPFPMHQGPVRQIIPAMVADRRRGSPSTRSVNSRVPHAVAAIVQKCMEPDPGSRYASALQLQEDLQRQIDNRPLKYAPDTSVSERLGKWARRHPRMTSTTSVLLFSGLIVASILGLLAVRQARLDRFEAALAVDTLGADLGRIEFLLADANSQPARVDEGLQLCRKQESRYGLANLENLRHNRLFAPLDDRGKRLVRDRLGELCSISARTHAGRAATLAGEQRVRQLAAARSLLERSERIYDRAPPRAYWQVRAEVARLQGDAADEKFASERANSSSASSAREKLLLVPTLVDRGQGLEALELLESATRENSSDGFAWLVRGQYEANLGRVDRAIDSLTVGVDLQPDNDWAHEALGALLLKRGDPRAALDEFDKAARLQPSRPEHDINRALAAFAMGDMQKALAAIDRALARPDVPTRAWFVRSRIHQAQGNAEASQRDLAEGLKRTPNEPASFVVRALARLQNDTAGALQDLEAALRIDPSNREALQNKAAILGEIPDRIDDAIAALDRAVIVAPAAADSRIGRGVLLARKGNRKAALADAQAALTFDQSADTLYRAACIYALTSTHESSDAAEGFRLLVAAAAKDPVWLKIAAADPDLTSLRRGDALQQLLETLNKFLGVAQHGPKPRPAPR